MYQALNLRQIGNVDIPSGCTVYRIMEEMGIGHHPGHKPDGITRADRGSQYTGQLYQDTIHKYGIQQSMDSAGGRCHDDARCERMWARMGLGLSYDRYDIEKMATDGLETLVGRYFISHWNDRSVFSGSDPQCYVTALGRL